MADLDIFITSRVKRKIVVFFVTYPAIKMHTRGLASLLKEDPGNIQRELAKLEKAGFVSRQKKKNTFVYSANTDFLFFKELQAIVMKVRAQQNVARAPRYLENTKR
ncbi:MAG: ArsR family transcriptional regulator [bacterium]|nr:ArsR family transcriptional regulator [bacterium]